MIIGQPVNQRLVYFSGGQEAFLNSNSEHLPKHLS
jgi:hypothetical protein